LGNRNWELGGAGRGGGQGRTGGEWFEAGGEAKAVIRYGWAGPGWNCTRLLCSAAADADLHRFLKEWVRGGGSQKTEVKSKKGGKGE
jgi:hypothetical protein